MCERLHILMDPSWVKTDMGGNGAVIELHVSGFVTVTKLTTADMGTFSII